MALNRVKPSMIEIGNGWSTLLDAAAPRVYPEEFGAVADDDSEDCSEALQDALDASAARKVPLWIGNGKSYYYGTQLLPTQGASIEGDGTGTLVQLSGAGKFDNTANSTYDDRNGSNSCGIRFSQITKPVIRNVRLIYQSQVQSNLVHPLCFDRSTNILMEGCEITGFTCAEQVVISSCTGRFLNNYIHDMEMGGVTAAADNQLTGFGVDNDVFSGVTSDVEIAYNRIWNLTTSAAHEALYDTETDGINVIKVGSKVWAHHNDIRNCGEAIDSFGQGIYEDNTLKNCKIFHFKGTHGFSNAIVRNNYVEIGSGNGTGIAVWATDVAGGGTAQHVSDVEVYGNVIKDVPSGVDALVLVPSAGTYGFRDVTVVDNIINCNGATYGIKLSGTNTNNTARIARNRVINAATGDIDVSASAWSAWIVGETVVHEFAASGTGKKPSCASRCRVQLWGSGGGGGGGGRTASGSASSGGGGGGGGGYAEYWFEARDLSDTYAVTVASGGSGGAGSTSNGAAGSNGTAGDLTSFTDYVLTVRARGGGRGAGGQPGGNSGGGGGGDQFSQGGDATTSSGGSATGTGGGAGGAGAAAGAITAVKSGSGGGGGVNAAAGTAGGMSAEAGSGGGSGGGIHTTPANTAGGAGGAVAGVYTGASGGTGAAGTAGSRTQDGAGAGGGGGGSNASGVGYAGGAGAVGGGGGGGGGSGVSANGGAGGAGGAGYAIITWYM